MATTQARKARHREAMLKAQRAAQVIAAGGTYDQAAEAAGYTNRGTAYEMVQKYYQEQHTHDVEPARREAVARCDAMLRTWWPRAQARPHPEHSPLEALAVIQQAEVAEKVCERWERRRAKLLGLDAPVRVAHTMTSELDSEIEQLLSQLHQQAAPADG